MSEVNPADLVKASKPALWLIPPAAKIYMAQGLMDGAKKYGAYNWREKPIQYSFYLSAIERHLLRLIDRQELDPHSTLHNLCHILAGAAIVVDAMEQGTLIDDRAVSGKAGDIFKRLEEMSK